jgi:hypothetical protein
MKTNKVAVSKATEKLTPAQERKLIAQQIEANFGEPAMTLDQIAKQVGISKPLVHRLLQRALFKMACRVQEIMRAEQGPDARLPIFDCINLKKPTRKKNESIVRYPSHRSTPYCFH